MAAAVAWLILAIPSSALAVTAPTITSKPKTPTSSRTATFKFTAGPEAASFRCQIDGIGYAGCKSPRTYSSLSEGKHTFSVKAVASGGATSAASSFTWRVDVTPPPAPGVSGISAATTSTNVQFQLSDSESGVTYRCKLDAAAYAGCGAREYWGLGEGNHALSVTATDTAGNVTAPTVVPWNVDFVDMPAAPCGAATASPDINRFVVFVLENRSFPDIIGGPGTKAATQAPFQNALAAKCGLATDYYGVTHPSLPDYMAMTAGETLFTSDCNTCDSDGDSIFSQLESAGLTWRTYAEDMPAPCEDEDLRSVGYIRHHNPPIYFTRLADTCPTNDVPLGTTDGGSLASDLAAGTLANVTFVIPNNCNNAHDVCAGTGIQVKQADNWLASWLPLVVQSPAYTSGETAVFVTWDEGRGGTAGEDCLKTRSAGCHIVLLALNENLAAGARNPARSSHYDLLWTMEKAFGFPALGHAGDPGAVDLLAGFGLTEP
ncbi:MAG TPA: alkaline phosphatase family protein [Gaiellaceae bacterium]